MFDSFLDLLSPGLEGVFTFLCAMCFCDIQRGLLVAFLRASLALVHYFVVALRDRANDALRFERAAW